MTAPRPVILDGWHAIWALLKRDEIAKKYLLIGISEYVQQLIINYAGRTLPRYYFTPVRVRLSTVAWHRRRSKHSRTKCQSG